MVKTKRKQRRRRPKTKVNQVNKGKSNVNVNVAVNLNNKIITSRRRQNLREVRRALPGSKALQGYTRYGLPDLHSQSALLTNNMMAQFNNFKSELESNQRALQAQQEAYNLKQRRYLDAILVAGGDDPGESPAVEAVAEHDPYQQMAQAALRSASAPTPRVGAQRTLAQELALGEADES